MSTAISSSYTATYSQTGVTFDMFRVRDDKIMEHWDSDANQALQVGQPAARGEDGATAESRALFADFSAAVLVGGGTERASEGPTSARPSTRKGRTISVSLTSRAVTRSA